MEQTNDKRPQTSYRWQLPIGPQNDKDHRLKIMNSFTRRKEPFVSNEAKTIKWYSCGPTVYDVAHLGHARCYITFDIIRRILTDYFGYHVMYVMNITDIDDKIIKRARSGRLCDNFISSTLGSMASGGDVQQLVDQLKQMMTDYKLRRADENDPAKLEMMSNILKASNESIGSIASTKQITKESLEKLRDIISDDQDSRLAHTITDHEIFKALTLQFEQEYHDDMQKLGVLPPSTLTRVSEFIDETGIYIKRLEANGYAYRAGGSVYFDTEKFDANPKHSYAKLVREAFGHKASLDEGEGELSNTQDTKKSPNDFALWKKSKPGEPCWTTQDYEAGRPGWHIECSVMASHLLGQNFDIHSGGCDLKFPHHDNEIAQAEAYYDSGSDWVNYFVHSGHLTISGCKMSKSLKNFITIRQALKDYTARQLRFAFLAHGWTETLDYSPNTMNTAISYEKTFNEFFLNVSDIYRRKFNRESDRPGGNPRLCEHFRKWTSDDQKLNQEFINAVNKVDVALCDNFDTRTTLNILSSLVKECNKRPDSDLSLLGEISSYVEKLLSTFGAGFDEFRLMMESLQKTSNLSRDSGDNSETVLKYVETLAQFRADIRRISKAKTDDKGASIKQILALCDNLRDQTLPHLGVRLEDKEVAGAPFVVKLVDPETLAREKALAEKMEQEKKLKEETLRLEKLKLQQQREAKMKMPPSEMFISQTDKYSKFDDKGMPTHDFDGKEITKSALKKLQKLYAEQESRYNKYLEDQKAKP